MPDNRYKTPVDLERAVKDAARKSAQDTSRAVQDYYSYRLIERIFSEHPHAFVLKGGMGMVARLERARYTRDADFLYKGDDLAKAIDELKRLASKDLDDFLQFEFVGIREVAKDQEYRDGVKMEFAPILGGTKRMNTISLDLVADRVFEDDADLITPVSRLEIKGIPVFDYSVYPVVYSIADKVCATLQLYPGDRPSSRVRDLVDLVTYISKERLDGTALAYRIEREARLRKLWPITCFKVPKLWHESHNTTYRKSAKEAGVIDFCANVSAAEAAVKSCVDPAIRHETENRFWDPEQHNWLIH